jgi:hypothetical protein
VEHKVKGTVSWRVGENIGISFETPLTNCTAFVTHISIVIKYFK